MATLAEKIEISRSQRQQQPSLVSKIEQARKTRKLEFPSFEEVQAQAKAPPLPWADVPTEAFKNIPSSAMEFGKNIWQAVSHPIQTGKGISDLVVGVMQHTLPEDLRAFPQQQEMARQMGQFFKDRYGSSENLKQTITEDPIGFLNDISIMVSGGAGAVGKVGQVSKLGTLQKLGQVGQRVGRAADPLGLGAAVVGGGVGLRTPINSLTKTALQMSKQKGIVRIDQLSEAFLAKGLNLKRGSLKVLDKDIKKIRSEINNIIDKKTAEGIIIKTDDIVKSLDNLTDDAARQGLETLDLQVIEKMKTDFLELHGATLTPRQVQDLKVGFNKGFKGNLHEQAGQARIKVRNTLRTSAKNKLEELHPELRVLNKDEGVMIELNKAVEDAIIAYEQRPTFESRGLMAGGLAAGVVGVTAGAATESVLTGALFAATAAVTVKILTNPKIQIKLAKALRKSRQAIESGKIPARTTTPAFQFGRLADIESQAGQTQEIQPTINPKRLQQQLRR